MKLWNEYIFPKTTSEAVNLLSRYNGQARIIAGGTDVILDLHENRIPPLQALIDITRIPDLCNIEIYEGSISIGAAVTFSQILKSVDLKRSIPLLLDAVKTIGGRQIRNLGTLVGNITNASPAADGLPPLYALNAIIHILGENGGERHVPIADFIKDVRSVDLHLGEMVNAVNFPIPTSNWRMSFRKVGLRTSMAIALTNIAVMVRVNEEIVTDARIALGAVAPTVLRMKEAESSLIGLPVSSAVNSDAPRLSRLAACPIDDFRASASYRRSLVENLVHNQLSLLLSPVRV